MRSISWSKVFRVIWRVNAVGIFLVVVLAVVGLSATLLSELLRSSHRAQATAPDVAPHEAGKPELHLGTFMAVEGTQVVRAELAEMGEGSFSLKGSRSVTRNVLFFDTSDGKSWWLLPHSDAVLAGDRDLAILENGAEISLGKLYLIESESQGHQPQRTLVLADAKGTRQTTLAKGVMEIDATFTISREEARVVYRDQAGYHLAVVNPTETKIIRDTKWAITFPPRK